LALNTVTLTWNLVNLIQDGLPARITLVPTSLLQDTADALTVPAVSYSVTFTAGFGHIEGIIACDNPHLSPGGWAYLLTVTCPVPLGTGQAGTAVVGPELVFLNSAGGPVQDLSGLVEVYAVNQFQPYLLAPPGLPSAGQTVTASGNGVASIWTTLTAAAAGADLAGTSAAETIRAEAAEALLAPKASPVLTGTPTAPTAAALTASTQLATTAYADAAAAAEASRAQAAEGLLAPKASPALAGVPTAATATPLTSSTQLATTAFTTGAVAAETIRAQAAEVLLASLGGAAFTGEVTVPVPVNPSDAATKSYADSIASGLVVKVSVQEATIAALPANTYANGSSGVGATLTATAHGALTVDGIAVALADRVLVQDEAAPANNGIYVLTTLGTGSVSWVLTRSTDMNTAAQVPGAFVFCEEGTANAGGGFTVTSAGPFTIGTSAITWTQFSGAGEITAGAGLAQAGNTLSLAVSPALTGTPTAATAAPLTSSTQLATTAYADAATAAEKARALAAEAVVAAAVTAEAASRAAAVTAGITSAETFATTAAASAQAAAEAYATAGAGVIYSGNFVQSGDADATASINRAIASAPSGTVILIPNTVNSISGAGIIFAGNDIELRGWGDSSVLQAAGSTQTSIIGSSSPAAQRWKISNMRIDGGTFFYFNMALIRATGATMQGLEFDHVTFTNGATGVYLQQCSDVKFSHCKFKGNTLTGQPQGTMLDIGAGARRIKLSYCNFESYANAVIGASGGLPYDLLIDDIEIDHCYFDGSWWLIPACTTAQAGTPANSGGTVTYGTQALTDTSASFTGSTSFAAGKNNIRAMPVRCTGTITTSQQLALIDTAANSGAGFLAAASYGIVTRGDIVRTASAWAMVEEISSDGHTLRISQWRSMTTWQVVSAPAATTAYTVYGVLFGYLAGITSTTALSIDRWHDYLGNIVTPPAGTLYEIMSPHPNYAVNMNPGTANLRVTHSEFFANWSDQISTYANESQIIGNYIHDGEDGGITIESGTGVTADRHIVSGNRIRHQGSAGMFMWGTNCNVTGNAFQGCSWVNMVSGTGIGDISVGGSGSVFSGNTFVSDSGISGVAAQQYGIVLASGGNIVSLDNIFGGHTVADIWVASTTGAPNTIDAAAGVSIGCGSSVIPPNVRYTGTGAPSVIAANGSVYSQTDDVTGEPVWFYTNGAWAQSTSGGGSGGSSTGSLSTPTGLTVTPVGTTGSTVYDYVIQAVAGSDVTPASTEVSITNGNAVLSSGNYNQLSWTAVPGAVAYNVCGRAHNTESLLAQISGTAYNDTGAATPAASRNLMTLGTATPSFAGGLTTGWSIAGSGSHVTMTADQTTGPNANGCSVKIVTDGSVTELGLETTSTGAMATVGSGVLTYTLSFYAKGTATVTAYLQSVPAYAASLVGTFTLTSNWTRYVVTHTVPASQTALWIDFYAATGSTQTFWISSVQVEQALSASAYIDTTTAVALASSAAQLSATATLTYTAIANGATQAQPITVTGATTGQVADVGMPATFPAGCIAYGFVSATNTVSVIIANLSGASVTPGSLPVTVELH
jgi:hypothetical protein